MASANIDFHGSLFNEGTDITPAIARAANIARTYGLGLVKARTPVDTSNLKQSWKADLEGNGIRYTNGAYYAGFVENGTRKMAGRFMLADSLPDIENVFYDELAKDVGKTLAADTISTAPTPNYENAVVSSNPTKYPNVGSKVAPKQTTGLTKKKFTKKYLFANPNDIVSGKGKQFVNAARPRYQKNQRDFTPEFKVR